MNNRYKIIVSSKILYKEIDLDGEIKEITLGTGINCDCRIRKEYFFGDIQLTFTKINSEWNIYCSENIYISLGDIKKLLTKTLYHGDSFSIRYQDSDNELFEISFMIDFDYQEKDYQRKIYLEDNSKVKIGGTSDCDVQIYDDFLGQDYFVLLFKNNKAVIESSKTKYGVNINGKKNHVGEINNLDFFSIVGFSFYLKDSIVYTTSSDCIVIKNLVSDLEFDSNNSLEYPKFNRNTRIQYLLPEEELKIQKPIQKPEKPKKNILMTLIPALIMLALTIVLRGILGSGGTFVIYSAISMTVGVVVSVITHFQNKKEYKENYEKRILDYNEYINKKRTVIEEARTKELTNRKLIYTSLEESINDVNVFSKRIFEKSVLEKDFLHVYLGTGTTESINQVKFDKDEFIDLDDPLVNIPEDVANQYKYLYDAPIISDFNLSSGIGVVGQEELLLETLKNITLDLTIRHFYRSVKFLYILKNEEKDRINWIRWLRNVYNDKLDIRNIVCDDESKNILLEYIYKILSSRESDERTNIVYEEQYVIFVTDSSAISTHPVSKYIENSKKYGFTFVFFDQYEEKLPKGCTEIIRLNSDLNQVLKSENGDLIHQYKMPHVDDKISKQVAIKLASVYVDEVTLEGQLTKNISLFEMLGIISVDDLNLNNRWKESKAFKSLKAPLGVRNNNEIVYLDISDKSNAHGPHGLVAGTTGSGKSEILQTYILSMSTLFHPYEVSFVLIDFKGGGMANQFKNLPHLIGTITNIDGREINRSLLSIKSELVKRQEMFSKAGVNHINDYIVLYKDNKVEKPMPHLIMIVDEFAELKAEHPDFMKELISAARIGRTLGIHLILATQKPAGVVDAQIWSNSKFKLCLKVQTKEDSNEVIKTPLAAEIVEPGRAYFQVGNNEIFELFQSAYSGANIPLGNEMNEKVFSVYERNFWGKKTLKYTNKSNNSNLKNISQLQAIVDYTNDFCVNKGILKLDGICLPSLKDIIRVNEISYEKIHQQKIIVPFGYYDDPEQQYQGSIELELSKENVYIVGSAQTGKTVMLQTILYGLLNKYTSEQVNIYIVDCGSMVLKLFDESNHIGGVVLSNEEEKCKNLFKLLNKTVVQRKKILSSKGVGNYASYLEAGYTDMPMIVLAIDNMAAFKEYFPLQSDELNSLSREAQGVGISLVITAATSNALNYRTQANFAKKLALNCNDNNEYSNVLGHCKVTPKENSGRGLCLVDRRILEYQVAIVGQSDKEADRSKELIEFIELKNKENVAKAKLIPMIPDKLILETELQNDTKKFCNKGVLPIGMDFTTIDYAFVNFNTMGSFALLGETEIKNKFTSNFLKMVSKTVVFHNIEAIVIDDKLKALSECEKYGFVRKYVTDATEGKNIILDYCEMISERSEERGFEDYFIMLVINNSDLFNKICSDKKESKMLSDAMKKAKECGAFMLINNIENQNVGFSASDILKTVKEERQAIVFAPLAENKFFEVPGRPKSENLFDETMGYLFTSKTNNKIKIFD